MIELHKQISKKYNVFNSRFIPETELRAEDLGNKCYSFMEVHHVLKRIPLIPLKFSGFCNYFCALNF